MEKDQQTEQSLIISYLTLRKTIGILGIALPFVLFLGALLIFREGIQSSISSYYYTGMRDVFVGALWAIGIFLFSYRGYEPIDNITGNLGCLFALGVALFPTAPDVNPSDAQKVVGFFHMAFAALFFFTMIFFSLFLFTKTKPQIPPTRRKLQRNLVYRVCGYLMILCVVLMTLYYMLPKSWTAPFVPYNPVFWLETLAILSFGISWLVKGEAILKDEAAKESLAESPSENA